MATSGTTQHVAKVEGQVSNGAAEIIEASRPYVVTCTLLGTAPILFHAWNVQAVEEKAAAAKGSKAKKQDDLESYVYRDTDGNLGLPGTNVVAALVDAGRYMQDPRSPRKSAMDLIKAGIVPLTIVAPFEPAIARWDYEDAQRVTIQRAAITRVRPAMREGWQATLQLLVNTPEYLPPPTVASLLNQAGRLVGVCDHRPTFGRFTVIGFTVAQED